MYRYRYAIPLIPQNKHVSGMVHQSENKVLKHCGSRGAAFEGSIQQAGAD